MDQKNLSALRSFLTDERSGGYLLFGAVALSLLLANSPLSSAWFHLFEFKLNPGISGLDKPLHFWINDLLMAVFFLLAGLEIKRELRYGELQNLRKASLPVFAALGGMLIPAGIFLLFNGHTANQHAWGIPMATDIAFSLTILAACGKKIPLSLKIFLTTLALTDDLGAILVIAFFYSSAINLYWLTGMVVIVIFLLMLNKFNVRPLIFYLIPGLLLWYCTYRTGIHATIAGVLLACCIPDSSVETSPLRRLEHQLSKPVAFGIMPLFALANTAITLDTINIHMFISRLSLGIMLGLLLGKPLGIVGASILALKFKLALKPSGMGLRQLTGLGLLGGIGFSMSIFISLICYPGGGQQNVNCLTILLASVLAGISGFLLLNHTN